MAEFLAVDEKKRKSCKVCKMLIDPSAFQQGLSVFVASAADCENCEVAKATPLPENEIILDIYYSLPANYDGMTGLRVITADDIYKTMMLLEIPRDLWCDYFNRVTFYHNKTSAAMARRQNLESSKSKDRSKGKMEEVR
jgi:hypothetical protein